jgi:hypothetical protein
LWNGPLPVVYFASTYRIDDSNDNQILYSSDGKRYVADLDLKKLGASSSYVWSVNNVKETNLTSLPFTDSADSISEDDLAKATSSPLIPILLIGAAYFIFFR